MAATATAVAVAFGGLPTGNASHHEDRGELQPTSSRSAWTEDSVETEDGRATVAAGLSPLSAALRVLHLRRARAGEAGGLTTSQRALARDLALHEDLASIVTSVTRCPVGDDSKPGMLCQLSLKTRASLMEEGRGLETGSGSGLSSAQQPHWHPNQHGTRTGADPGGRPSDGPHSGSSGRATSPPLGGPLGSGGGVGVPLAAGQARLEVPRVVIPSEPRAPAVPVFEAQPLIGRCEIMERNIHMGCAYQKRLEAAGASQEDIQRLTAPFWCLLSQAFMSADAAAGPRAASTPLRAADSPKDEDPASAPLPPLCPFCEERALDIKASWALLEGRAGGGSPSLVPAPPCRRSVGPEITICEVRQHASRDDCWLAAHGCVYKIPRVFIDRQHPGSSQSIMRHAGTDCTEDFDFHSRQAQAQWRQYQIGQLAPCDPTKRGSRCVIS